MGLSALHLLLAFLSVFSATSAGFPQSEITSPSCKCTLSSDDCWPDAAAWRYLNSSVDGQLVATKPPASPCHDPNFDSAACTEVTTRWSDAFWRAAQPGAMQDSLFEMDGERGCLLSDNRSVGCFQGRVPVFSVNVSHVSHVQNAIRFASRYNLRVSVKGTGHDYFGRSNAPGSLGIWTHNLKNITVVEEFVPQGCGDDFAGQSGVTIGAGVPWEEVYRAADAERRFIAGAQCSSVGAAGGYPLAGGHSQLSPTYGLSADNVLEYQLVTADGEFVVANSCQNKDLFWALRGGGGGTYGVVISVTHATHPPLDSLQFAAYLISSNTSEAFEKLMTEFVKANPGLSDSGWGGFFLLAKNTLIIQYLLPNKDVSYAESSFQGFLSEVKTIPGVNVNGAMQSFSSYLEWHKAVQCSKAGCSYPTGASELLVSRLIPNTTFSESPERLAQVLIEIRNQGYDRVMGYLTAGGRVSVEQDNAVNPAWRKALWHMIIVKLFPENETLEFKKSVASSITSTGGLLRDLTPGSGCYMNEADVNEPDWKQAFFGDNYDRLKTIKDGVDPHGLFVCRHCVGSDEWSEDLNCKTSSSQF